MAPTPSQPRFSSSTSRSPRRSAPPSNVKIPSSASSASSSSSSISSAFPPDDARAMSPRRDSATTDRMSREARGVMEAQARSLHASLIALEGRIDQVRSEHDKLESGSKFLQSYIGELMAASKITAPGAAGGGTSGAGSGSSHGSSARRGEEHSSKRSGRLK